MIEWYISLVKEIYGNFEHWILPIFLTVLVAFIICFAVIFNAYLEEKRKNPWRYGYEHGYWI
jgi:hypothetical protein